MHGVGIIVGKDSHTRNVEFAQGLDDTHGNLSPIGNQYFMYSLAVHVQENDTAKIQKERQPVQIAFRFFGWYL
jgi:hypothetical protein